MGQHEDPARSVTPHIDAADFPISREDLVLIAEDDGAPHEIINLFKSLPREEYDSREMVFRDLSEAARRMAMGNTHEEDPHRDRRNIGRDLVEEHPGAAGRHP
jgi:Protein of unknown function (DUF2795)